MHSDLFMRNLFTVAIFVSISTSSATSWRTKGDAQLRQRDAIVRSVVIQQPTWTAENIFKEVQPRIAAAGLVPIRFSNLAHKLSDLRQELKLPRTWGGMRVEHTAFLRDELARDSSQSAASVLAKFRAEFGPKAENARRVRIWWDSTVFRVRRKASGVPQSSPNLPDDWWDLGDEFDKFLSLDSHPTTSASTATTSTAASGAAASKPKRTRQKRGRDPLLKPRDDIIQSLLLAHPTWTNAEVSRAATPLIVAAGFEPISFSLMVRQIRKFKRGVQSAVIVPPTNTSPAPDPGLPLDWWDLGDEWAKLLASDTEGDGNR